MWTQMVGKVALARAVPLNHSWAIAFLFTPRGLRTRVLSHDDRTFRITFDFLEHQLVIPQGAYYHDELKEFILPYDVVRRAASPEAAIAAFVETTYDHAAA